MTKPAEKADAAKVVAHIQSLGSSFKILKATPANHIGAVIADAVLQVGHRWKTHVAKRVKDIENNYPSAATLSGLSAIHDAQKLLNWNGVDEQRRFRQTVEFFSNERVSGKTIDTVSDLSKWLASAVNRNRLLTRSPRSDKAGIPKIADKTVDYYCVLVGIPNAVAIDSLLREFLKDAGIKGVGPSQYSMARAIVQLAAKQMHIRPIDLDRSIWEFQSGKGAKRKNMRRNSNSSRNSPQVTGGMSARQVVPNLYPLTTLQLAKGTILTGKINNLGKDNKLISGWRRRDITVSKDPKRIYPKAGDEIILVDCRREVYQSHFTEPETNDSACLGLPHNLKPWYQNHYPENEIGDDREVYFEYTGCGCVFWIYSSQEWGAIKNLPIQVV